MSVMKTWDNAVIEQEYRRLRFAVSVGSYLGDWRVIWAGGWDKGRVFYWVLLEHCVRECHLHQSQD